MDKRSFQILFSSLFLLILFLAGCGKKGPLLAPLARLPQEIKQVAGWQQGASLYLKWEFEPIYTDGTSLTFPLTIEIWLAKSKVGESQSSTAELKPEDFEKRAEILARIIVNEPTELVKGEWKFDLLGPNYFQRKYVFSTRLLDKRQKKSAFSPLVTITPQNLPLPPDNLRAEVKEKEIALQWTVPEGFILGGEGLSVKGYHVYRRETEGQWRRLTKTPLKRLIYEDKDFEFGRTYFYKVRAVVNESEPYIESDDSREIKVEAQDVFPPPPPSRIVAIGSREGIALSWEPSPAEDVIGYKIWRRREDEKDFRLLTSQPITELSFTDTGAVAGYIYEYYLTAVDQQGNESKKSTIIREKKGE